MQRAASVSHIPPKSRVQAGEALTGRQAGRLLGTLAAAQAPAEASPHPRGRTMSHPCINQPPGQHSTSTNLLAWLWSAHGLISCRTSGSLPSTRTTSSTVPVVP